MCLCVEREREIEREKERKLDCYKFSCLHERIIESSVRTISDKIFLFLNCRLEHLNKPSSNQLTSANSIVNDQKSTDAPLSPKTAIQNTFLDSKKYSDRSLADKMTSENSCSNQIRKSTLNSSIQTSNSTVSIDENTNTNICYPFDSCKSVADFRYYSGFTEYWLIIYVQAAYSNRNPVDLIKASDKQNRLAKSMQNLNTNTKIEKKDSKNTEAHNLCRHFESEKKTRTLTVIS